METVVCGLPLNENGSERLNQHPAGGVFQQWPVEMSRSGYSKTNTATLDIRQKIAIFLYPKHQQLRFLFNVPFKL